MLRICSLAGEALATLSAAEVEGKSVKLLKVALAKQIGVPRFRQRWLNEEHTELHDDAVAPCCDVQLVVLPFVQASKAELRQLLSACRENSSEKVVGLLRRPLNPDGVRERRKFLPALHLAAQHGHSEIVQLLLEAGTDADIAGDDVFFDFSDDDQDVEDDAEDEEDDDEDDDEVYDEDEDENDDDDDEEEEEEDEDDEEAENADDDRSLQTTALHRAAGSGRLEVVKLLLKAGADKDAAQKDGMTALNKAACYGHSEVVKVLLEARADKDAANHFGTTALHLAASYGHSEVVKLLLQSGAAKDAADRGGMTALHMAAGFGRSEVVKWLLQAGADKDVKDSMNKFPLDLALSSGFDEVVHLLQPEPQTRKRQKLTS